jgi:hypothetical protein
MAEKCQVVDWSSLVASDPAHVDRDYGAVTPPEYKGMRWCAWPRLDPECSYLLVDRSGTERNRPHVVWGQ